MKEIQSQLEALQEKQHRLTENWAREEEAYQQFCLKEKLQQKMAATQPPLSVDPQVQIAVETLLQSLPPEQHQHLHFVISYLNSLGSMNKIQLDQSFFSPKLRPPSVSLLTEVFKEPWIVLKLIHCINLKRDTILH